MPDRARPDGERLEIKPCDEAGIAAAESYVLLHTMNVYWAKWSEEAGGALAGQELNFEKAYRAKYAPPAHKYTVVEIRGLPRTKLCDLIHSKSTASGLAGDELTRRKTFTTNDLRLVMRREINLGMSQEALLCSWGEPDRRNRTVTVAGEHIQWIYGKSYVYTENGIVTSYQD
jgi:hypothetical protein